MRYIIFLACIALLSSCGVVKNVVRKNESSKVERDSTAKSQATTDVKEKEETTTITTEEVDTTAKVSGSKVHGGIPLKELSKKPFILKDHNQTVTVSIDSAGKLQVTGIVKDRNVNLKFRKRTEHKVLKDRQSSLNHKSEVSAKSSASSTKRDIDKKVERSGVPWWSWIMIVLVVLIVIYLTLRKRIPFLP